LETITALAPLMDEQKYLIVGLLIFKIFCLIQKDIVKKSKYWEIIKVPNKCDRWDYLIETEVA